METGPDGAAELGRNAALGGGIGHPEIEAINHSIVAKIRHLGRWRGVRDHPGIGFGNLQQDGDHLFGRMLVISAYTQATAA